MIRESNLKKLNDNVKVDNATWRKLIDEVIEDERRTRDEYVRIREEGDRNSKEV